MAWSRASQAITELGFEEATPIQSQSIPIALTGKDMIGQAQTGTGKTAFGLPLIHKIAKEEERIVALIMTPTRELAIQVAEEIGKLSVLKESVPWLFMVDRISGVRSAL